MLEFCECGSIVNGNRCSNERCPANSDLVRSAWLIRGVKFKFSKSVTLMRAQRLVREKYPKEVKVNEAD